MKAAELLEQKGIQFRLIKLSDKGISFDDVVSNAEDELNQNEICKTIVVKDKKGNKYAFLLKGDQKIDFAKAKEVIGKKISIVRDLKKSTGKEPGAICPFLLEMPVYVDEAVFATEKINFGSGDHLFGLEMHAKDLEKVMDFKVVNIRNL